VIAKGFAVQEQALAEHNVRIAGLEEEVARLKRGKKRKAIPNPNRRFITLSEALVSGEAIPGRGDQEDPIVVVESELEEELEVALETGVAVALESPLRTTRFGRVVKKPRYE
jgi:hypothetical protein